MKTWSFEFYNEISACFPFLYYTRIVKTRIVKYRSGIYILAIYEDQNGHPQI